MMEYTPPRTTLREHGPLKFIFGAYVRLYRVNDEHRSSSYLLRRHAVRYPNRFLAALGTSFTSHKSYKFLSENEYYAFGNDYMRDPTYIDAGSVHFRPGLIRRKPRAPRKVLLSQWK